MNSILLPALNSGPSTAQALNALGLCQGLTMLSLEQHQAQTIQSHALQQLNHYARKLLLLLGEWIVAPAAWLPASGLRAPPDESWP